MPQTKLKKFLKLIKTIIKAIQQKLPTIAMRKCVLFFYSSWRIIGLIICGILFLYYPIGGMIINNINTDTSIDISGSENNRSTTIETISYLIRQEVNDKIWTPNLPFFYPSYFLDNMPEFQLGLIEGLKEITTAIASRWEPNVASKEEQLLTNAAKLLQYPPDVWLFSKENKLIPAPSTHSQYRKARKLLIKYNQSLSDESIILYKTPQDLIYFLKEISSKLHQTATKLENHIREESSDYIDNQADNLFYRARGLAYADYMLIKALAADYKTVLIEANVYLDWTRMQKSLESASQLNPLLVRNGRIDSSFTPNHLSAEGFYILKAKSLMQNITHKLEKFFNKK